MYCREEEKEEANELVCAERREEQEKEEKANELVCAERIVERRRRRRRLMS